MGALPADFTWTSEDDYKLKAAAQLGVPLETIATGAVQFSKQFTVQELHDRWHALLYDPIIAAEASARMLELEFFALSQKINISNQDTIEEASKKRNPEGVRKRYSAMRKRMRVHPLNPLDLTFPDANFNNICIENFENTENVEQQQQQQQQPLAIEFLANGVVNNNDPNNDMNLDVNQQTLIYENQNCILEEEDNFMEDTDDFKEILDLLETEGPESPIKLENQTCVTDTHTNGNNYLMELSNTLFDLDMEDDGNVLDKSYMNDLSSLLLDSPKKDDSIVSTFPVSDYPLEESKSLEGIMGITLPSTSKSVIICTLNTEDPDIPSNDDVFLLPFTSPYTMQNDMPRPSPHKTSIKDSGVGWNRDFRIPKPKDNRYQKPQFDTPVIGSQLRTELLDHGSEEALVKNDGQHESQTQVHPMAVKSEHELHQGSDVFTNCGNVNGIEEHHAFGTIQEEETTNEIESKQVAVLQLPVDDDMSSFSDDDDDIPSYSDVEAMILDEKLSEDEKGIYQNGNWSYRNLQTLKYKNPNFQKRFIRLEQAANGYMKRDMSSWEAFAILQGWQFIYYIKKPEILMGRATEDVIVDVDLGREGCDSRISRRQAVIQLDKRGLFRIKNLGKYSIFINSDELSRNQSTALTSSCLIEIRGMAFLFETNEESIKRYVNSMKNKSDLVN